MRRFRSLFGVFLAAIVLVGTAGCYGGNNSGSVSGSDKVIKLTLWGSADDQPLLKEMIEDFKKSDPTTIYEIDTKIVGEDKAQEEITKDPAAAADVFAIAHDQLGKLVKDGMIYENTKYADEVKNNNTESSIAASTYEGKLYGYPVSQKTYFLYYDKSIYSADDVRSLNTMLNKSVGPGVAKIGIDIENAYYSASFFLTNGCELFGNDGTNSSAVTFNNEQGVEAAKYIANLKSKGVSSVKGEESDPLFASKKMAAYISGDWKAASYKEKLGQNYGVAELPMIDMGSGEKHMKSFAGYNIYGINAKTKYPVEAMKLANFLTNKESQKKRFENRNLLPVNKELILDESIKKDPMVSAIFAQLKNSVVMPAIPQMSKFWTPTGAIAKDLFESKISGADMKSKLDQLVSDIKS